MDAERYLKETPLLDYSSEAIQSLIRKRDWRRLDEFHRIKGVYDFVRNEILFGYSAGDRLPASRVLAEGYGQCNTKGILFMALLRGVEVPCRIHGFTIDKRLQKGTMTGIVYQNAPAEIFHSWVEVFLEGRWYALEALILDQGYLCALQAAHPTCTGAFCGYGVAVGDFRHPPVEWNRNNTYIQSEGIRRDLGVYDSPDELMARHGQQMSGPREFLYRHLGRHLMNRNVQRIRAGRGGRI